MRRVAPSSSSTRAITVSILDDYFDTLHTLPCFAKLAPFDVTSGTIMSRTTTCSPSD
jgi:hypothetical protein